MIIGICDDEPIIVEQLRHMVLKYARNKNVEAEIHTFLSGVALLEAKIPLDLLFLDIEMPEMDGIEAGKKLRLSQKNCKIIMATSRVERFKESFYIQAFRFLTKPFESNELEEALDAVMQSQIGNRALEFYMGRNLYQVMEKEIQFIRAYDSYVEVFTEKHTFRKETSLRELEQILDTRLFFRIHRQYLVNMMHVQSYKDGMIAIGSTQLPIARRKKKEFEYTYMQFDVTYR